MNKIDYRWVAIALIGVALIFVSLLAQSTKELTEAKQRIATNHMVPKSHLGVYYGLTDSSIVIVLDEKDPVQKQIALEAGRYLASKK